MPSRKEFVDFVCQQISGAGKIELANLFGDYGVYCDGKSVGMICNNAFYLRPTDAGRRLLGKFLEEEVPMEGGKTYFRIDYLDDAEELVELLQATRDAVPAGKPRHRHQAICKHNQ